MLVTNLAPDDVSFSYGTTRSGTRGLGLHPDGHGLRGNRADTVQSPQLWRPQPGRIATPLRRSFRRALGGSEPIRASIGVAST